jgi:hypothetical protein
MGQSPKEWNFWWHSHNTMSTQPSSQDHTTMRLLARNMGGWACGAVFNVKNEVTGYMAYGHPILKGQTAEAFLKVEIERIAETPIKQQVDAWMKENVKTRPTVAIPSKQPYKQGTGMAWGPKSGGGATTSVVKPKAEDLPVGHSISPIFTDEYVRSRLEDINAKLITVGFGNLDPHDVTFLASYWDAFPDYDPFEGWEPTLDERLDAEIDLEIEFPAELYEND